jgi:hypothetical protein
MFDHHGTFILSSGGVAKTDEWSFSAINIHKAILKLKVENAPFNPFGSSGFAIDYYDWSTYEWKTLGELTRWYTISHWNDYKEIDVTEICKANPKFKWRWSAWGPFMLFYTCAHYTAVLHLEYTGEEPKGQGTTSSTPFGNEALAPIAQMMSYMMSIMFMMMLMSMMISIIGTMAEMAGGG